jgi:cobalt-zinc-cadmium efflux system protein
LNKLKLAAGLSFIYMLAEAIGGWYANSLALIADAGHMLTDVMAMALTITAAWFAERPATERKTYGYYRLEILAAFANGNLLILLSVWVVYEAVQRWRAPSAVLGGELTLIAAGGLVINLIAAWLLSSVDRQDLNLRGAWLHVIGDLLGSVAAIAAGALILLNSWYWADTVGSVLISVIIIYSSLRLVLDSVNVLLEGTPRHIDIRTVESAILRTSGVTGVHDLHVWTISSGIDALSAHINHDDKLSHAEVLGTVRQMLHETFGIDHLTIQIETVKNETEALYVCSTGTKCFEPSEHAGRTPSRPKSSVSSSAK